jgi:hypothetical protein
MKHDKHSNDVVNLSRFSPPMMRPRTTSRTGFVSQFMGVAGIATTSRLFEPLAPTVG